MKTNRKTAIIVGVLYIIGTVAGVLSVVISTPILNGPDFLSKVSANENQFVIAALFVLLMGLALALVPVTLFPILKKQNESLALGYVVFRGALETVTYIAMVITWFFLLILSREYVAAGAPEDSYFQTLGDLFLQGNEFDQYDFGNRFQPGRSDALLFIVSVKTHPPLDIRLGFHCDRIASGHRLLDPLPAHDPFFDDRPGCGISNILARNGHGSVADRKRIQSIRNRCPVCENSDERAFERVIDLL